MRHVARFRDGNAVCIRNHVRSYCRPFHDANVKVTPLNQDIGAQKRPPPSRAYTPPVRGGPLARAGGGHYVIGGGSGGGPPRQAWQDQEQPSPQPAQIWPAVPSPAEPSNLPL